MHWEEDTRVVFARDKTDAINKKKDIKKEYNFYIHMKRTLLNNKSHSKIIKQVNNILNDLDYSYNNVCYPPDMR